MNLYNEIRTYFINGGRFDPFGAEPDLSLERKRQHMAKMSKKQSRNWDKRQNSTKVINGKRIPADANLN